MKIFYNVYMCPELRDVRCILEQGFASSGVSTPDVGEEGDTQYDDLK